MADIHQYEPLWESWRLLDGPLGNGGNSVVYKAVRNVLGDTEYCAVKHISLPRDKKELAQIINDLGTDNSVTVKAYLFERLKEKLVEYRTQRSFAGHPNLVQTYDPCYREKTDMPGYDLFIRMECLETITNRMNRAREKEKEVMRLGIDICNALEALHTENIVHRDVKQENILVSDAGVYKLADFGTARVVDHKTLMTINGTPGYMAKEVRLEQPADHRIDIYSLGIVLFSLMNEGHLPFENKNGTINRANAQQLTGKELPKPSEASTAFAEVILKACAYEPDDRYATAAEMKVAIERLYTGENEQLGSTPKRAPWILVVAALMALGLGVGGWVLGTRQPKPETDELAARVETMTMDLAEKTSEIDALTLTVNEKSTTIESLMADSADMAVQIEILTADSAEKTAQIETLTADVEGKAGEIETLKAEAEKQSSDIESLTGVGEEKDQQITALIAETTEKSKQIETLSTEVATKEATIVILTAEKASLTTQIEELTANWTEKTDSLNATIAEKDQQIETLTAEVNQGYAQITSMAAEAAEKDAQIETLTADITAKSTELDTLTAEINTKDAQLAELMVAAEINAQANTQSVDDTKRAELDAKFAVGKYVQFGTYPQTKSGDDQTPIEWIVLDRQEDRALLLSRYALDCQLYHNNTGEKVTWETCSLRKWLSMTFYDKAFSEEERKGIVLTTVDNGESQGNSAKKLTGVGAETQDYVFLLSAQEHAHYLDASMQKCIPTDYALKQGGYLCDLTDSTYTLDGHRCGQWWLRTSGDSYVSAGLIMPDGTIAKTYITHEGGEVRPAIWVDLNSSVF